MHSVCTGNENGESFITQTKPTPTPTTPCLSEQTVEKLNWNYSKVKHGRIEIEINYNP